jgi:hypothetical protein
MNKYALFAVAALLLIVGGCWMLPPKPGSDNLGETSNQSSAEPAPQVAPTVTTTAPVQETSKAPENVTQSKYIAAVPAIPNDTNVTSVKELMISGNLNLQDNLDMCPHLVRSFDCDRYDIRSCKFKNIVGQDDFYPDIMACRDGYSYRNENINHKYCFVQECRALEKGNVVYAYGGSVAYAEYIYHVDNVPGGIMTHYTLAKCGEEMQEFDTSNGCKSYKTQLKSI